MLWQLAGVKEKMRTVSLQELRYLKEFVRFQEIPSRLRSIEREHGTIRRYPLFEGWSEPDAQIDVFNGRKWRRVNFLKKQDDNKIVYKDDENTWPQPINPYTVAPAGYFTDFEEPEIVLPDIDNKFWTAILILSAAEK